MTRALSAFVFLVVVFGTTFGAIKIGIDDGWPPLLAAGLRFGVAGLLVLAVARTSGATKPLSWEELRGVASVGFTVTACTFGALYEAERVLPSGLAAVLAATGPLFAVALSLAMGTRRFDPSIAVGLIVATGGVALVSGVSAVSGTPALAASLAIVASEFAFAWGLAQAKNMRASVPALQLAGLQQAIGGGALLVLSLVLEHRGPMHVGGAGIIALAYLILVGTAVAHTVSTWLAGATSATFASSWTYISPFIALLFGALYLHELPSANAWIGGALVVAGAVVLNRNLRTTIVQAASRTN